MTTELWDRIRKEFTLSLTGLREVVLSVSERVSRKVQLLNLHWRAAQLNRDIQGQYQGLGRKLAEGNPRHREVVRGDLPAAESNGLGDMVAGVAAEVAALKKEVLLVDAVAQELEAESLGEALLTMQRDLASRGAALERLVLASGSSLIGCSIRKAGLGPNVWVMGVVRGPALLAPLETLVFRVGDIVFLGGVRSELAKVIPTLVEPRHVPA